MSSKESRDNIPDERRTLRAACQTCAAAKTKCSLQGAPALETGVRCDRCVRLDKPCIEQEIRPRPSKRGKYNTKRHADIELKVNRLFELIGDKQPAPVPGATAAPLAAGNIVSEDVPFHPECAGASTLNAEPAAAHQANTPPLSNSSVLLHYTPTQQKKLLEVFYAQHAEAFPFVLLPPRWTVQQFSQERPLLLKIMLTVASYHDFKSQSIWAQDILSDITERVFLKGEKTLQLLQALLLWIVWYHPFVIANPQLVNLIHLQQSMVSDMGLDNYGARFVGIEAWKTSISKTVHGPSFSAQPRTIEERRTVLGVFFVCSTIITAFGLPELARPNAFLDESCRILEAECATASDMLVCFLVRMQLIVARANRAIGEEIDNASQVSAGPVITCVRAYQGDMWTLYNGVPDYVRANLHCQLHFHHGRMSIYRLLVDCLVRSPPATHGSMNVLSMLSAAAQSVEELCRIIFSMPPSSYHSTPCTLIVTLVPSLLMLVKLKNLQYGDWSLEQMHPGLDVLWLLEHAADSFEAVSAAGQVNGFPLVGNDLSDRWARRFRLFASWQRGTSNSDLRAAATQLGIATDHGAGGPSGSGFDISSLDAMFSLGDLDSLDSMFWQGLINGAPDGGGGS